MLAGARLLDLCGAQTRHFGQIVFLFGYLESRAQPKGSDERVGVVAQRSHVGVRDHGALFFTAKQNANFHVEPTVRNKDHAVGGRHERRSAAENLAARERLFLGNNHLGVMRLQRSCRLMNGLGKLNCA